MRVEKVCLIAVYDSYLKNLMPLARYFAAQGASVELLVSDLVAERVAETLTGGLKYQRINIEDLRNGRFSREAQVIFIGAGGDDCVKICAALRDSPAILVSMFPGITGGRIYQGFNDRSGADIILLSNPVDYEKYVNYARDFKLQPRPFMLGFLSLSKIQKSGGDDFVFFEQNFPGMRYSEKAYIIDRLAEIARARSGQKVIIKLRSRPGEATPHRGRVDIETLFARAKSKGAVPANLQLSSASMEEVLQSAALCISVSSAAILEALYNNINCAILSDFGMREDLGNEFFSGSNLFASFAEIMRSEIPQVNAKWREAHLFGAAENFENFLTMLEDFTANSRQPLTKINITREVLAKKEIYGSRHLRNEILLKKYRKLKNSPRLFFADSKNPLIKLWAKFR